MKYAVHVFLFGGFVGSRVLDDPEDIWQDPIFDDPTESEDGVGYQIHVVPGGSVYTVFEQCGRRLRLFEGSQERRDWKLIGTFNYGEDRQPALDALNRMVADRVGFVEQPIVVTDLTDQASPDALAGVH